MIINLTDIIIYICGIVTIIWAIDVIYVLYFYNGKDSLRRKVEEAEKKIKK